MISKLDHLVITTDNLVDCIAFYKALGFKAQNSGERWELFSKDFKINVHCKGRELEPKAKNVQMGSADLCFETDCSLVECIDLLAQKDIDIELGIVTRQGVRGEMHSIYLRDPDGNLVELCNYE